MSENNPQTYTAEIDKKDRLTKTVYYISFRLKEPHSMVFTPGQYATFLIDEKTRRQYSFCDAPADPSVFSLVIDTSPMGTGSKFFLEKNIGDTVRCLAPLGTFVLDKTAHRKKVMVATGTGVAPLRSMVAGYLQDGGTDDITLYWGMRHEEDLYWAEYFQDMSAAHPNFRFVLTLSKPQGTWEGKSGRVTQHVIQEEQNPAGSDFYLCGNRMMIADIETQLAERNVPVAQIHKEMYF